MENKVNIFVSNGTLLAPGDFPKDDVHSLSTLACQKLPLHNAAMKVFSYVCFISLENLNTSKQRFQLICS